jgi:hypothetical protein
LERDLNPKPPSHEIRLLAAGMWHAVEWY